MTMEYTEIEFEMDGIPVELQVRNVGDKNLQSSIQIEVKEYHPKRVKYISVNIPYDKVSKFLKGLKE